MPGYEFPLPEGPTALDRAKLATAAAGLVGTLIVFAFAWTMARVFAGKDREPEGVALDAA